jgi:glycogen operon protein
VRSFYRGDDGFVAPLADRLLGSPQIYGHKEREAEASVNFVTCHDGFTLNDLVSYNHKLNEANGENNRDGSDDNRSYDWGVETLRNRQVKNYLAVTLLSLGLPMILMGDEVRRTQHGNNNAYCQDNQISWFDWTLLEKHPDVHRFVRLLNAHRLMRDFGPSLSLNQLLRTANRSWHGVKLGQPDWSVTSHSLAVYAEAQNKHLLLYFILNAYWEPLEFELPHRPWHRWIDTSLDSPDDIVELHSGQPVAGPAYPAAPRSLVALVARL